VTVLVDSLRSTREGGYLNTPKSSSCASLLARLQSDFPERVQVRLYRAPGLPSWLEKLVGKRFVEGWGLQHMKIYGGDDEVMTSGANLSNDYFTNRRDRYVLLKDPAVSQYMYTLLMITARYSHSIKANPVQEGVSDDSAHSAYELSWDEGRSLPMKIDSLTHGPKSWKSAMKREVEMMTESWHESQGAVSPDSKEVNTDRIHLVPLLQMGRLGITHETTCVPVILQAADSPNARLDFTTGYFSINPVYADIILKGRFKSDIITASPKANGFYGSKGISRHLPAAYTWLESLFWGRLRAKDRLSKVTVREWSKSGWTYHAKGERSLMRSLSIPATDHTPLYLQESGCTPREVLYRPSVC
jgi:CDP-diacylglycerol--glycerol-3-phosphate 3-phosphatidyltransferase